MEVTNAMKMAAVKAYARRDGKCRPVAMGDALAAALAAAPQPTASDVPHDVVRALEPFAKYMDGGLDRDDKEQPLPDDHGVGWVYLTMGDFRRASAAYASLATPAPSTSTDALDDDAKEAALNIGWRWFGVGHHDAAAVASEIEQLIADDRAKRAPSPSTEEALRARNALLTKSLEKAIETLDDISDSPGPFADDAAWTRVKAAEEALPSLRDTLSALSR